MLDPATLLPPSAEPVAESPGIIDLLLVISENLRLLLIGPLLAGLVALGISFAITPTFTGRVQFMSPKQPPNPAANALSELGLFGGVGAFAGIRNPADQYVALAKSYSIADALIDQFGLTERYETKLKDDTRKVLAARSSVTVGPKDGLITIEVEDADPKFAADLANTYVHELRQLLNRLALTEAQQRRVFFEKQVLDAKANMVRSEQALRASGVDGTALKLSTAAALEGVARIKAQISAQEVKLAAMRGFLAESAPDFRQASTELAALRAQMERASKEDNTPSGSNDYIAKFRDFKYHETLLGIYLRQFELARVDESRDGTVIQVVDAAQPPQRKTRPKKALIAVLTTLMTGFVLLLFVFARHGIRSARDNPASAPKLQRLAAIWRFSGSPR